MNLKITLFSSLFFLVLSGCAQNTALLIGPTYTFANTGNIYQSGATFGSNQIVTGVTGKSVSANVKTALQPKKTDTEFKRLVKKNIEETRKKLNLSNQ